jgi:uncharacterized phage protein gp47/JayE
MPLAIPDPLSLQDRNASMFEAQFPGCDARSPNRAMTVICRVNAMATFDEYTYLAGLGQELMPDTAENWLARHASIRGVPQILAAAASGSGTVATTGSSAITLPVGFAFLDPISGIIALVTAATTIPAAGSAAVPLVASEPGAQSNLAGGTVMNVVSPYPGLTPQSCTLTSAGLTGGTDLESIDDWRARILAEWRAPAMGGDAEDYETWASAVYPGLYVYVAPAQIQGLGNVGVTIAMPGPAVPSGPEVAAVQAALLAKKPVGSRVQTFAASLLPVNVSITLNPDTTATRAAATSALQLFFAQDGKIGGPVMNPVDGTTSPGGIIYMSRLDNALSSSDGEYSHERQAPTADVTPGTGQIPVLGTITFVPAT